MSDSNVRDISRVAMGDEHIVSAEAMEHVLGTGDLGKLTTSQRVQYYLKVCESIGINPLTRPFRFLNFQGAVVMYATRDCTDQLRDKRKISIEIKEKRLDGDLFMVTAHASEPSGRQDEDVGAVTLGRLQGDARANAIMRAITKSKRRVTLSICGLGYLDEDEVATLPGAVTYAHDAAAPPAPAPEPPAADDGSAPDRVAMWLDAFALAARDAPDAEAMDRLLTGDGAERLKKALTDSGDARLFRYNEIVFGGLNKFADPPKDDDVPTDPPT